MKQLKIREDLVPLILNWEKEFEFRKLSKGLVEGDYEYVSINKIKQETRCGICKECVELGEYCETWKRKVYLTAHLKPLGINPKFQPSIIQSKKIDSWYTGNDNYYTGWTGKIDDKSLKFVNENYVEEKIDFVVYRITNVKEVE